MTDLQNLLDHNRIASLRTHGVLVLDVDDTLLARRAGRSSVGETYADSRAAQLIPRLVSKGIRIALITGHGWAQLERRLGRPLFENLPNGRENILLYANRGATKIDFDGSEFRIDEICGSEYLISPSEGEALRSVFARLINALPRELSSDLEKPEMEIRDQVIYGLRPVPSEMRSQLIELGNKELSELGLDGRFRIEPAGRTTIEIASRSLSKAHACRDAFEKTAADLGISASEVSRASITIGDEFGPGGNDTAISQAYPEILCISVSTETPADAPKNVKSVSEAGSQQGSDLTAEILLAIAKALD